MEQEKCYCKELQGQENIIVHYSGCPEGDWYKEYHSLPWYKRLINPNPYKYYQGFWDKLP